MLKQLDPIHTKGSQQIYAEAKPLWRHHPARHRDWTFVLASKAGLTALAAWSTRVVMPAIQRMPWRTPDNHPPHTLQSSLPGGKEEHGQHSAS